MLGSVGPKRAHRVFGEQRPRRRANTQEVGPSFCRDFQKGNQAWGLAWGVWPLWRVPQPSLGAALLPAVNREVRGVSREGPERLSPRWKIPVVSGALGVGSAGPRPGHRSPDSPGPLAFLARIRGSTEAKLTFLRPSATSCSAGLSCPRLPPVHRVRPHPAPHTDLPGLPRSHLHLPSAFTVWPDGQCEAGLALELSQAGDGAVLSPQPCPKLSLSDSPLGWVYTGS